MPLKGTRSRPSLRHARNLPGILAAGYIRADSFVDRSSALRVEAEDLNVKALRKQRRVPLAPFGRVADYVPFYFAPRSPMLYTLAKGNQDRLRRRMAEFSDLPGVTVLLYPPQDSPPPATMPVHTQRPRMTLGRAALLTLLSAYAELSWLEGSTVTRGGASLLEIQKLMYFLQEAGQPLRLDYVKGIYGPYAENLIHVLQALEGHYLRGYSDRTQRVLDLSPIGLMDGAEDEARQWLTANADNESTDRITGVLKLITDFASPYGVELLATVHWTATRDTAGRETDSATLTATIRAWNKRKERLFTEHHVRVATERLKELNWIAS
jgi:uncharacterized protein YwgA